MTLRPGIKAMFDIYTRFQTYIIVLARVVLITGQTWYMACVRMRNTLFILMVYALLQLVVKATTHSCSYSPWPYPCLYSSRTHSYSCSYKYEVDTHALYRIIMRTLHAVPATCYDWVLRILVLALRTEQVIFAYLQQALIILLVEAEVVNFDRWIWNIERIVLFFQKILCVRLEMDNLRIMAFLDLPALNSKPFPEPFELSQVIISSSMPRRGRCRHLFRTNLTSLRLRRGQTKAGDHRFALWLLHCTGT